LIKQSDKTELVNTLLYSCCTITKLQASDVNYSL